MYEMSNSNMDWSPMRYVREFHKWSCHVCFRKQWDLSHVYHVCCM